MAHILFIRLLPDPRCAVYVGEFTKSVRTCPSGQFLLFMDEASLSLLYSGISYSCVIFPSIMSSHSLYLLVQAPLGDVARGREWYDTES